MLVGLNILFSLSPCHFRKALYITDSNVALSQYFYMTASNVSNPPDGSVGLQKIKRFLIDQSSFLLRAHCR